MAEQVHRYNWISNLKHQSTELSPKPKSLKAHTLFLIWNTIKRAEPARNADLFNYNMWSSAEFLTKLCCYRKTKHLNLEAFCALKWHSSLTDSHFVLFFLVLLILFNFGVFFFSFTPDCS